MMPEVHREFSPVVGAHLVIKPGERIGYQTQAVIVMTPYGDFLALGNVGEGMNYATFHVRNVRRLNTHGQQAEPKETPS